MTIKYLKIGGNPDVVIWDDADDPNALVTDAPIIVGGSSVTDHGAMSGLSDDDHTQYHNNTRGDARYFTVLDEVTGSVAIAANARALVTLHDLGGTPAHEFWIGSVYNVDTRVAQYSQEFSTADAIILNLDWALTQTSSGLWQVRIFNREALTRTAVYHFIRLGIPA